MRFAGKSVLVTGAGRGLGAAIAVAFAREGASVALASRTLDELEETAAAIREEGGRAIARRTDVRKEAEVEALVDATVAEFGRLDVAVSNAGAFVHAARFPRLAEAEWDEALQVNLKGPWLVAKHASPHMTEDGCILNVTTGLAHASVSHDGTRFPSVPYAPYSIAKAALEDLTRVLAERVRPRVNAVNPGVVRTAMSNGLGLEPQAVTPVFLWLASDEARDVRGRVILARDWLAEHPEARPPRPKRVLPPVDG